MCCVLLCLEFALTCRLFHSSSTTATLSVQTGGVSVTRGAARTVQNVFLVLTSIMISSLQGGEKVRRWVGIRGDF